MFKAVRISILLLILFFVSVSTWLSQARSTDWNDSLWVKIYPINGDGSAAATRYMQSLKVGDFKQLEDFIARETRRYNRTITQPVRVELGTEVREQPPELGSNPNMFTVMWWSLKMRWWASDVTDKQDRISPDVKIFVRFHEPDMHVVLESSVGLQKGMIGIVNGYASRRYRGTNNVIVAHEFLHTLGATDKYSPIDGHPIAPHGLAEPDKKPIYPQSKAEIMGGRIALAKNDSVIPQSLKYAIIGPLTAEEINLVN